MKITKQMKDSLLDMMIQRITPWEELEELGQKLVEQLSADTGNIVFENMKSCVKEYPEFCTTTDTIVFEDLFRYGNNKAFNWLLKLPFKVVVTGNAWLAELKIRRPCKDGMNINFTGAIAETIGAIFTWGDKRVEAEKNIKVILASTDTSEKLIEALPEAKDLIDKVVEDEELCQKERTGKKEGTKSTVFDHAEYVNEIFAKRGL